MEVRFGDTEQRRCAAQFIGQFAGHLQVFFEGHQCAGGWLERTTGHHRCSDREHRRPPRALADNLDDFVGTKARSHTEIERLSRSQRVNGQ
ncbi:hypothetical protein D3C72_1143590 [compost metagenome]